MLTSKQRAILRGKANTMDPVYIVGKGEIDETLIQGVKDCLDARELIKLKVLENSMYNAREASVKLAEATGADCVQVKMCIRDSVDPERRAGAGSRHRNGIGRRAAEHRGRERSRRQGRHRPAPQRERGPRHLPAAGHRSARLFPHSSDMMSTLYQHSPPGRLQPTFSKLPDIYFCR